MNNSNRIRAFANGTDFMDWQDMNCCRCRFYQADATQDFTCELDEALAMAAIDDGTVSMEHAKRLGWREGDGGICRKCTEFVEE